MTLFRRRRGGAERRLGEEAAVQRDDDSLATQGPQPWDGRPRLGEVGIHGVARLRRWDAVESAEAPGVLGDELEFVALPDGTFVGEGGRLRGDVTPLAEAVKASIQPPYRAEAVRRGPSTWAVAAKQIAVAEVPTLVADAVELTAVGGQTTLLIDGRLSLERLRELEQLGEAEGPDYVVRATRLAGDLWEVEATAL